MAVRVTQHVVEALIAVPMPLYDPTTPDASTVAVTQQVLEVLIADNPRARVSQYVLEVLVSEGDDPLDPPDPPDPGGGGVRTFGYAG